MPESKQHLLMKNKAKSTFDNLGYDLISFDGITVNGYKPDLIMENDVEVLFIEIVVTSDHDSDEVVPTYNGKPVRFLKYYSLDSWVPTTTMVISIETWRLINAHKDFGDTMEDALLKLLKSKGETS